MKTWISRKIAAFRKYFGIVRVVAKYAANNFHRIKIILGGLLLMAGRKVRFEARMQYLGEVFTFMFESLIDYRVFREVFIREEYALSLPKELRIIVDVGSNVGLSIIYFRLKYPRAHIYGFEPDPNNYRRCVANTRQFSNITVQNVAVAGAETDIPFYVDPKQGWSSSTKRRRKRQQKIIVKAKPLGVLMNELNIESINLLKFDVEGAETQIFKGFTRLHDVDVFIGEYHADIDDYGIENFAALFSSFDTTVERTSNIRFVVTAFRDAYKA